MDTAQTSLVISDDSLKSNEENEDDENEWLTELPETDYYTDTEYSVSEIGDRIPIYSDDDF